MADDKSKTGWQDRVRVASRQEYEVRDFADNDRETLELEARRLKK
jgi:hypothetical protein